MILPTLFQIWPLNLHPRADQCKGHSRLECINHTLFQTKTVKMDALFQTKTAKKTIPFGAHIPYKAYIREYPPPPSNQFPGSTFQSPSVEIGFQIPIVQLDSGFFQLYYGFQSSGFRIFNNLNFPGFRNPLGGETQTDIALFPINAVIDWAGLPFLVSHTSFVLP